MLWSCTCCRERQLAAAGLYVHGLSSAELPSAAWIRHGGEIQKGQEALGVFVRNWGNRGEGSTELLGTRGGEPEPGVHFPLPGF